MRRFSSRCTPSTSHRCGRRRCLIIYSHILLATNGQDHHINGQDLLFCQRVKVQRNVQFQPAAILVPHPHFANIHVDLVRPLRPLNGHTYLVTVIDRISRWPETIPLFSITLQTAPKPSFPAGSPILGCQPSSHFTEGLSSHLHCGQPSATCSTSAIRQQWHTTYNQTGWQSGSTVG